MKEFLIKISLIIILKMQLRDLEDKPHAGQAQIFAEGAKSPCSCPATLQPHRVTALKMPCNTF